MQTITTIGLDIAKSVFQVHGVDVGGQVIVRRQLNPALRVSTLKNVLGPYRHAVDLSRYQEGLRQAGLPE